MNSISELIIQARKSKNLTQEQLAKLSNINLRTIQRIENNKNMPRVSTLELICNVLEIEIPAIKKESKKIISFDRVFNYLFLIVINFIIIGIIGWMTIDSEANLNSRFAGFLLSFFIPFFIVFFTQNMDSTVRLFKFGIGCLLYVITTIIIVGFPYAFVSGLIPCLTICIFTLYYGEKLLLINQ
ncbi:MAG: helix-turn-helix transcriptional regulator [Saprospiraceae bacterium]